MSERRRLHLFVSEDSELRPRSEREGLQDVGTIYPEPFRAPLSTWSFSARVLEALAEHTWQPSQDGYQLNVVLTPALAHGEARVDDVRDDFREVYVGLSRAHWLASTVGEKRRTLIDIFVRQLEPMREAWSLDWSSLQAAAKSMIESYETITRPVGNMMPVTLGIDLATKLEIAAWARTAPAMRLAIGRAVAEGTRSSGHDLDDPELVRLPTGESVVRAMANGIALVLVPSGRLRRGFDEDQLARLDRIYETLWHHESDPDLERRFPRRLTPFGADVPCHVDRTDEVDIPAMWIAEANCDVEDERRPWEEASEFGRGLATWRRALGFVGDQRMTLPTSDELLWAASAGDARLFPWGDDATPIRDLIEGSAHALAEAYGKEAGPCLPHAEGDPLATFARRNSFGLAGALNHLTWCIPQPDLDDPAPFVLVGGALDFAPWQGGWEAMLFLTRVVSRTAFDGRVGAPRACVRPMIRLSCDGTNRSAET